MKNRLSLTVSLLLMLFFCLSFSGCFLLVIPGAALVGHTIQKSNEEYDEIIVNYGLKYKQYYETMEIKNEIRKDQGDEAEIIPEFREWLEIQSKTDKERKAVERYLRINQSAK